MELNYRRIILGGKFELFHFGTEFGSVQRSSPDFASQLNRLMGILDLDKILELNTAFNTRVEPVDGGNINLELKLNLNINAQEGCFRTKEQADGVVVGGECLDFSVLQTNADCPMILISAPNGAVAICHGGFKTIVNDDGSSIVLNAIKYFTECGFLPKELMLYVGRGAGPCCYGKETCNFDDLKKMYGNDVVGIVVNPPRVGEKSINLNLIVVRQAEQAGITLIENDSQCTSCAGIDVSEMNKPDYFGKWYSNLRQSRAENPLRNAVVVKRVMREKQVFV